MSKKRITKYTIEYWITLGFTNKDAQKKVKDYKLLRRKDRNICIEYWLHRGYSKKDGILEIKKIQSENSKKKKNKFTYVQIEFWIQKGLTKNEAQEKVKILKSNLKTPVQIEFWTRKGLTQNEAIEKIKILQIENSKKRKDFNNGRNIKKYLNLGYTEKEATEELKKIQTTFSKEICIKKFGKKQGLKRWNDRQLKWQNTLNKRYTKKELNKLKSFTYNDCIKKYGKERADRWLINKFSRTGVTYSKIQINLFESLSKLINRPCSFGKNEYVFKNKEYTYIVDFYDFKTKKVIEFNGDFWHMNPKKYDKNHIHPIINKPAIKIWNNDNIRINNLKKNKDVKDVLVIWESSFIESEKDILNKCLTYLNNG